MKFVGVSIFLLAISGVCSADFMCRKCKDVDHCKSKMRFFGNCDSNVCSQKFDANGQLFEAKCEDDKAKKEGCQIIADKLLTQCYCKDSMCVVSSEPITTTPATTSTAKTTLLTTSTVPTTSASSTPTTTEPSTTTAEASTTLSSSGIPSVHTLLVLALSFLVLVFSM